MLEKKFACYLLSSVILVSAHMSANIFPRTAGLIAQATSAQKRTLTTYHTPKKYTQVIDLLRVVIGSKDILDDFYTLCDIVNERSYINMYNHSILSGFADKRQDVLIRLLKQGIYHMGVPMSDHFESYRRSQHGSWVMTCSLDSISEVHVQFPRIQDIWRYYSDFEIKHYPDLLLLHMQDLGSRIVPQYKELKHAKSRR